ncbi:hypothetical protein BT93_H3357 [Corymbia citriodora subsp. variegata]|nr:hypothetical protein BT93_H3357 [Corymbia citriodora subsp. variegata]KAF8018439.1 hypothetical protein BT93_H3357 [Corymbia citriodora subsp. variegata]KAF8018440.1 hypothetical protein BT93_H3357 [Corymbia citriodora subsp. variegata]KAF8018441.1 hypothetical protein BT93_H3357 [Corymbia citriodora subsp. variegata]KAF8018442.1 hypothetical protein BT93_H3357 [Corymbia citriodora subsp. variegata]
MSSRRRPLHACAVSILATAHRAYTRARDFNGPSGSLSKSFTRLANKISPFVYAVQHQCLSMLSFADGTILTAEDIIEKVFPPSSFVFDKIDELVQVTEGLPEKIDDVINKVPGFIHQIPFLDWMLVHCILWSSFWVSIITRWESRTVREKEILVDANCNECCGRSVCLDDAHCPADQEPHFDSRKTGQFSPVSEAVSETRSTDVETRDEGSYREVLQRGVKESYKDVLRKGMKEEIEEENKDSLEGENKRIGVKTEDNGQIGDESTSDPILELFESAWLKKPARRVKGDSIARSASYF